jgi:hypothetical protein
MEKKSAVRKLITSVEQLIDAYADNLNHIAKGEEVKHPIEDKTIDTMIKIVKEIVNFEQFERIANPDIKKMTKELEPKAIGNIYEHALTKVKNGNSKH